jgi:hypothetical protein
MPSTTINDLQDVVSTTCYQAPKHQRRLEWVNPYFAMRNVTIPSNICPDAKAALERKLSVIPAAALGLIRRNQ